MGKLPTTLLRRPSLPAGCLQTFSTSSSSHTPISLPLQSSSVLPTTISSIKISPTQVRHATFIPRPRRPYMFTQLVQLSDGSTFTIRTTSPQALYKSTKDSRNHILWQPNNKQLRNIEVDEAGKLAAFRGRYGTHWDLDGGRGAAEAAAKAAEEAKAAADAAERQEKTEGKAPQQSDVTEKPTAQVKPAETTEKKASAAAAAAVTSSPAAPAQEDLFESFADLLSAYAVEDQNVKGGLSAKDQARKDKSSKKK